MKHERPPTVDISHRQELSNRCWDHIRFCVFIESCGVCLITHKWPSCHLVHFLWVCWGLGGGLHGHVVPVFHRCQVYICQLYTTLRNLTRSRTLSLKLHTWLNEKATDSDQSNLVTKLTAVNRKLPSSNGKDQHKIHFCLRKWGEFFFSVQSANL